MKIYINLSMLRFLILNAMLFIFTSSCNNKDQEDSELGDGRDKSSNDGSSKSADVFKDDNYDNIADFDNIDTLNFYDQDPNRNDSSASVRYEPGPQEHLNSAGTEGNIDVEFGKENMNGVNDDDFENVSDTAKAQRADISKQSIMARELFNQLGNISEKKSQKKIYREIILKCPDTQEAQLAYYKLANIMMFEEDEANYYGVISLLKDFYLKYPRSNRLSVVMPILLRAYEELNRWDKIAEVYTYLFSNNSDVLSKDIIKHSYKYAQSLEKTNRIDEAIKWYRKTLEKDEGKNNSFIINLAKTRLSDLTRNKKN